MHGLDNNPPMHQEKAQWPIADKKNTTIFLLDILIIIIFVLTIIPLFQLGSFFSLKNY